MIGLEAGDGRKFLMLSYPRNKIYYNHIRGSPAVLAQQVVAADLDDNFWSIFRIRKNQKINKPYHRVNFCKHSDCVDQRLGIKIFMNVFIVQKSITL